MLIITSTSTRERRTLPQAWSLRKGSAPSSENEALLFRPTVETAPEELKLAVHLRGQVRPRRWTLGCQPSRGDFNR